MSKLNCLLWAANIEVLHGLFQPARNFGEILNSGKTTTVNAPKGYSPGILRTPSHEELDNYFKTAGWLEGYTAYNKKHTHWCGIFQTYLLKKAGVNCHWNREIVDDSGGQDLEITTGKEAQTDLAIGDIVKVSWGQHHFMVLEPVKTGPVKSIEGNAGGLKYPLLAANWMANMTHNIVGDIQYRYRVIS